MNGYPYCDGNLHALDQYQRTVDAQSRWEYAVEAETIRIFQDDKDLLEVVRDMGDKETLPEALWAAAERNLKELEDEE
jgi:hypothetical protein